MERLPNPQPQPEVTIPRLQPAPSGKDLAGQTTEPMDPGKATSDLEISEDEKREMNEALDLFYSKQLRS